MPEGPSLVILKEELQMFKGKKILAADGNAGFEKSLLINKTLTDIRTWGKHCFLLANKTTIRIHFLLFGSYSLDQPKPGRKIRLHVKFKNGDVYFYASAIRIVEEDIEESYDWTADVMSDLWSPLNARKKLKAIPETLVCDALLDQNIFSGVGNIIKNEVLYRIKLHPETKVKDIPPAKLSALIRESRIYSFQFLEWKKAYVLKKHWLAHTKRKCLRCDLPFIKKYCGKTKRRTFFCTGCQVKYK